MRTVRFRASCLSKLPLIQVPSKDCERRVADIAALLHNLAMERTGLSAMILFASFAAPALAHDRSEADVELADQQYNRALERSDIATLRKMIAGGYVFTDPSGRVTGRDEVIGGIASGRIRITSHGAAMACFQPFAWPAQPLIDSGLY